MKTLVRKTILLLIITLGFAACKDNAKEAETSEAKEAAEASMEATTYAVDTQASTIMWKGSKPLGTHNGTIDLVSGSLSVAGDELQAGSFKIDMKTIEDLDLEGESKANLEAHLMGTVEGKEGDFFNVNKFPYSVFELTTVRNENGKTILGGNLTIKEKTNNIEFPATVQMMGDKVMIKSDPFSLDRTRWDVNYGSKTVFDNLGDKFIDDEMEITIDLVANKA